jgi:hypothetical protein
VLHLSDLFNELINRQIYVSWVKIKILSGKNPTQLSQILDSKINHNFLDNPVNPEALALKSGKFFGSDLKTTRNKHELEPVWDLQTDTFGVGSRLSFMKKNPVWADLSQNNFTFNKLLTSQKYLRLFFYVPFADRIWICGSSIIDDMRAESDLDLVVLSKKFDGLPTVLITRFWLKLFLKIINRDVHSFWLELWLKLNQLFFPNSKIDKNRSKLKDTRLRFDLGLVLNDLGELENYKDRHTSKLGFLNLVEVVTDISNLPASSVFWVNSAEYRFAFQKTLLHKLLNLLKFLLSFFSLLLYPLFSLQILWVKLYKNPEVSEFSSINIWDSFTKIGFPETRLAKIEKAGLNNTQKKL